MLLKLFPSFLQMRNDNFDNHRPLRSLQRLFLTYFSIAPPWGLLHRRPDLQEFLTVLIPAFASFHCCWPTQELQKEIADLWMN